MRLKSFCSAMIGVLSLCSIATADADDRFGTRAQLESLSGVYSSTTPEPWYGGYGTRQFTFERGKWALTFVHALDPEMKKRTFQFRTEGPYSIVAPSKTVPGAFDAVFGYNTKSVTLLTTDEAFTGRFAGCGLKFGVEIDISERGCANWKPVKSCAEDHDLLAIDRSGVYFGVRQSDNDMCTADKRGTALLTPVVKQ